MQGKGAKPKILNEKSDRSKHSIPTSECNRGKKPEILSSESKSDKKSDILLSETKGGKIYCTPLHTNSGKIKTLSNNSMLVTDICRIEPRRSDMSQTDMRRLNRRSSLGSTSSSSSSGYSSASSLTTSTTVIPEDVKYKERRRSKRLAQNTVVGNIKVKTVISQLHIAVMRGFIEVIYHITRLLPHQAFLDLPNNTGRTALHLAVASGDSNIARHLIVCGASPVVRDRRGNTPLHTASGLGDAHLVNQLTRPVTVAEVMQARLSYAPAHTAGLLAADLANYDGQTCIHIAAQMGSKDILQHLTWYGADINAKEGKGGRTALHYAIDARDPQLMLFLVEACRASVNLQTYAGLTPYQLALANGATGLAQLLLDLGAPGEPMPDYLLHQDDLEYDEESLDLTSDVSGTVNGWGGMDDLKIGGVAVPMGMNVPVSQAPLNADLFL